MTNDPGDFAGTAIDSTVPHSARIWNYWLGGKDNYEVDRVAGEQFRQLTEALPSGSYLALSDGTSAVTGAPAEEAQQGYNESGALAYVLRTPEEIAGFFDGLELVDPGVVSCPRWRPDSAPFGSTAEIDVFCGVARKP